MTAASNAFERRARRLRRALRRHPAIERLANAAGVPVWRWYLRYRLGGEVELPATVRLDPGAIPLELPPEVAEELGAGRSGPGVVRGGGWDRRAVPRTAGRPNAVSTPLLAAFDRLGRPMLVGDRGGAGPAAGEEASVEARVVLRHRRWARIAREVRAYTAQRGGTAYQPYLHPDLADLPSDQGHERFDLLLSALPMRSGTLVDLGANSGYFSHRFEEAGFDCVAVERSEKEAHFLRALRDAAGKRFTIVKGSLTEVRLPERPDVVLALNIFHHFLKTEAGFRALRDLLGRLAARSMLFQTHRSGDPQMASAAHDMAPEAFVEWVRREGGFTSAETIGTASDGRPIFLLVRGD